MSSIKKLSYLFIVFILLMFIENIEAAQYTCKYQWDKDIKAGRKYDDKDSKTVEFTVKDGKIGWGNTAAKNLAGKDDIQNWSEKFGGFDASYYNKHNVCPPYVLVFDEGWTDTEYYVSDDDHVSSIKEAFLKEKKQWKKYYFLKLTNGPTFQLELDAKITLTFINQYKTVPEKKETQTVTYKQILGGEKFKSNPFKVEGHTFAGWRVEWIHDGKVTEIGKTIKNKSKISDVFNRIYDNYKGKYKSGDQIKLYAKWTLSSGLSTEEINDYELGESSCKANGHVWNKVELNGITYEYCNINNLTYVACGDAKDIPSEIPKIISFIVNFLKIATPIILVIMAIISMIKALASSVEDEIKKAQKSLTKKLIAAAMVFFVVNIVQFCISLVADSESRSTFNNLTEVDNLSDCFNCLLNNNCEMNTYYKTNVAGQDFYYSVVTGKSVSFDNEYYLGTDFYEGAKNTSCESYGYFGKSDGYNDSYHPKAVKVGETCYPLTESGNTLINYTQTLAGKGKIVNQKIYSANGKYYYWEGRINDYIEISSNTEIVTAYYRGSKPSSNTSASKPYYDYLNTGKEGYQPRYVKDGGKWYELRDSGFTYVNRTTNLFGESSVHNQKVLTANNKCYYWEGREASYIEVYCQNHNIYDDGIVGSDFYEGTKNTDCEEYGYFDSYHPKAVKVDGTCQVLTKTARQITNYTQTIDGVGKIVNQYIYSANGKYYYWEGRINNYIEIPSMTDIVTAYYRGGKPISNPNAERPYYNYLDTGKEGYQPRYVYDYDGSNWYELSDTGYKYINKTQTLWGEDKAITQKVLTANDKCYYWEGRTVSYVRIECRNYN